MTKLEALLLGTMSKERFEIIYILQTHLHARHAVALYGNDYKIFMYLGTFEQRFANLLK